MGTNAIRQALEFTGCIFLLFYIVFFGLDLSVDNDIPITMKIQIILYDNFNLQVKNRGFIFVFNLTAHKICMP